MIFLRFSSNIMNLYYIQLLIADKKSGITITTDFAIPSNTPEEALLKSAQYGTNGILQDRVDKLNYQW